MENKVPRASEIIEVDGPNGTKIRKKIIELPVDPPNSIRRILVDVDTTEDDVPLGGRLLDERETEGHLARSQRPDNILVGDTVRKMVPQGTVLTEENSIKGTVEAKLKQNRFRVRFENGEVGRFEAKELSKVW